jgi:uncharacterized membrane protein
MSKSLKYTCLLIASGLLSYWLTVSLTPYVILLAVKTGSKSTLNQPVYAGIITEKDRHVVMPNPDFLYVACGYDLRKSPVRITGVMPDSSYCSVALYAANTLNFYIRNDRQTADRNVDFLLVKKGEEDKYDNTENTIVSSPTSAGVMLVRILIEDTAKINYLKEIQHTFKVTPL